MASRASKLADLASTDSYAFSSVTTDTLSSSGAKSAFISGNFVITNTESKAGFATYLYNANDTYPRSFTDVGVDLDTQWGDNTSEKYGGLVWIKNRDGGFSHILYDTVRGTGNTKALYTDLVNNEGYYSGNSNLTSFDSNGFSVGTTTSTNVLNTTTYPKNVAWVFQTTHRVSGTTNHGKAYTSHYNPYTGFTIVKYEGSGVSGHEIPHHLGRELGFVIVKSLNNTTNWICKTEEKYNTNYILNLNNTNGYTDYGYEYITTSTVDSVVVEPANGNYTNGTGSYILYGWANSYYDDAGELNGNYEIGVYQGTGAAGNKITTRGKPAWLMVKRLDTTGQWWINDNQRGDSLRLFAESSSAESSSTSLTKNEDGFTLTDNNSNLNASGGQYLYMVIYDNDSASGKSNYTKSLEASTLQVTNGVVSYSHGVDTTGAVNSIENLGTTTLPNISWDI